MGGNHPDLGVDGIRELAGTAGEMIRNGVDAGIRLPEEG
jgi:hypothetical protein